jgi:hypothetical protein
MVNMERARQLREQGAPYRVLAERFGWSSASDAWNALNRQRQSRAKPKVKTYCRCFTCVPSLRLAARWRKDAR